jgi:hypothetical protein
MDLVALMRSRSWPNTCVGGGRRRRRQAALRRAAGRNNGAGRPAPPVQHLRAPRAPTGAAHLKGMRASQRQARALVMALYSAMSPAGVEVACALT